MTKKLTALLLLLATFSIAHAETIIVTSNADSGPGTLREALTKAAANGTGGTDYIHFSIPETNFQKRIITLVEELPSLTSNLVLDGTTQPGEAYAMTPAMICLKKDDYAPEFSMLRIENASNVSIYGLFLYYGYWKGFFGTPYRSSNLYNINLSRAFNIRIGAPGKGNVITGAVYGIYSNSDSCRNIMIQSNFLGLGGYYHNIDLSKEISDVVLESESAIRLINVKDITIGGPTAAEGNIIATSQAIYIDSDYPEGNGFINVQFNRFNRWYDNQKLIYRFRFERFIAICGVEDHPVDYRVTILDNNIPAYLQLANLTQPFLLQRNVFGNDFRDIHHELKCAIWNCPGGGTVGGESDADKNYFLTKQPNTYHWSLGWGQSGPITVLKNEFDCNSGFGSTILSEAPLIQMPVAQVDQTTATYVKGHATPNCRIDLYYDDACTACEGKTFITTVRSDVAGNWIYNGNITGTIVALAIDSRGYTSEFSKPLFNLDKAVVTQPSCGKKNGSITGITAEGAEAWYWINQITRDTVSRSIDLKNAGPGYYLLLARHGTACWNAAYQDYQLEDQSPAIMRNWENLVQPSCGKSNGGIYGWVVGRSAHSKMEWKNEAGIVVGTEPDLAQQFPGTYTLQVVDTVYGCKAEEMVTLTNQSGPSLNLGTVKIKNAGCGANNGGISGITAAQVTGTPTIRWEDEAGNVVGHAFDLNNIPGGRYRLLFQDASPCGTIETDYYTVGGSSKITINAAQATTTPSQCRYGSGSIKGVTVTGAMDYIWTNDKGVVVSNDLIPTVLLPGIYTLTAGTATGCPKTGPAMTVPVDPDMHFDPALQTTITPATCGKPNGSIELNRFPSGSYTFAWNGADAATVGTTMPLKNVAPGTYTLYATDAVGCTQRVTTAAVPAIAPPQLGTGTVQNDVCTQQQGSIRNIAVTNGTAPFTYTWYNGQQQTVGTTSNLQNVGAGIYQLQVRDAGGCTVQSPSYTITNETKTFQAPQYADQLIPRHTSTTLTPQNAQAGTYEWFDDAALLQKRGENITGVFATPNLPDDKTFYIRLREGTCSSSTAAVRIKVADDAKVYVPTAFTPNKDGKNDDIKPLVTGIFKLDYFAIYDRWGGVVFKTSDLTKGWDGFIKGLDAPVGVYVWMLKGTDYKGNVIQQKGTVTLIR